MFLSSRSSHGGYAFQYAGAIRRRNQLPRESKKDHQGSESHATEGALYPISGSIQESAVDHDTPRMTGPERLLSSRAENQTSLLEGEEKLIIVMVGLPARGKSYIARKVCRYLNWLQYPTKVFNVGEKRRKSGTKENKATGLNNDNLGNQPGNVAHTAAFFDPDDQNATQIREQLAMEVLDDLLQYLQEDGKVAIFDATNTTTERRAMIVKRVKRANSRLKVLFIESQCFNQTVLTSNINLKLSGPDYKAADPLNALVDFNSRIWMYEKRYSPIGEDEQRQGYSYCQVIDVGRKTITYNINNVLSCHISELLQDYHLYPRQIWLTRHGESADDINGTLGGDSCLSEDGLKFAESLSRFITRRRQCWSTCTVDHSWTDNRNSLSTAFEIWTSQSQKSVQTTQFFGNSYQKRHVRGLDELNAGALDGYPRCEIPHRFKDWFEKRQLDKFACRYPGARGEAYEDLIHRLKEIILDVEGSKNHVLFISGLAVIRILLAYFHGLPRKEIPHIDVPQGMLYLVDPQPYGVKIAEYRYNPACDSFDEVGLVGSENLQIDLAQGEILHPEKNGVLESISCINSQYGDCVSSLRLSDNLI